MSFSGVSSTASRAYDSFLTVLPSASSAASFTFPTVPLSDAVSACNNSLTFSIPLSWHSVAAFSHALHRIMSSSFMAFTFSSMFCCDAFLFSNKSFSSFMAPCSLHAHVASSCASCKSSSFSFMAFDNTVRNSQPTVPATLQAPYFSEDLPFLWGGLYHCLRDHLQSQGGTYSFQKKATLVHMPTGAHLNSSSFIMGSCSIFPALRTAC